MTTGAFAFKPQKGKPMKAFLKALAGLLLLTEAARAIAVLVLALAGG